ncbi:MAG: hypothetical protein AMXMBFR57_30310 [Acidimicrobiia bacterium]
MPSASISCATLAVEPWAGVPGPVMRPLLHAECTRWAVDLGWDLARDWAAVEPARRSGLLPGWVAHTPDGHIAGWAFAADGLDRRQLGALVADDGEVAVRLLRGGVLAGIEALGGFIRTTPTVNAGVFQSVSHSVQPYHYLVRQLGYGEPFGTAELSSETWQDADAESVADLFRQAYAADRSLRPFARVGTHEDWCDYVDALTRRPGCGVFSPESSVVVREGHTLLGVALVTSVGPTTAHLAQIAVTPAARTRGLGGALLAEAMRRASRHLRASRLSLLVSDANQSACRLYTRAGFHPEGEFLAL